MKAGLTKFSEQCPDARSSLHTQCGSIMNSTKRKPSTCRQVIYGKYDSCSVNLVDYYCNLVCIYLEVLKVLIGVSAKPGAR